MGMYILLGALAVLLGWGVAVFNGLVQRRNRVRNAWSDIDVQLKRRYDLVPNLVETVKAYKGYEASTLEKVTSARTSAMDAGDLAGKARAEGEFTDTLRTLFAVAENYPELKSSENFRKLQEELSALENDIQSARRYYNASVRELNNAVHTAPSNIIAALFSFKEEGFFGADEDEKGPVHISF